MILLLGGLSNAKGVCCALLADGTRDNQHTAHVTRVSGEVSQYEMADVNKVQP